MKQHKWHHSQNMADIRTSNWKLAITWWQTHEWFHVTHMPILFLTGFGQIRCTGHLASPLSSETHSAFCRHLIRSLDDFIRPRCRSATCGNLPLKKFTVGVGRIGNITTCIQNAMHNPRLHMSNKGVCRRKMPFHHRSLFVWHLHMLLSVTKSTVLQPEVSLSVTSSSDGISITPSCCKSIGGASFLISSETTGPWSIAFSPTSADGLLKNAGVSRSRKHGVTMFVTCTN